jgi:hypothetical protein
MKTSWRLYLKIVITFLAGGFFFAYPIPQIISSKYDELVILGFIIVFSSPFIFWWIWKKEVSIAIDKIKSMFNK